MTKLDKAAHEVELILESERFSRLIWIHGTSVQVQDPDAISTLVRLGSGTRIDAQHRRPITVHFALPTPMFISESRLSIRSVILDFITMGFTIVTAVHVWDGRVRIASFEGLGLSGEHRLEQFEIEGHPSVSRGINVSVEVDFRVDVDGGPSFVDFISAGGDFVTKSGGLVKAVSS